MRTGIRRVAVFATASLTVVQVNNRLHAHEAWMAPASAAQSTSSRSTYRIPTPAQRETEEKVVAVANRMKTSLVDGNLRLLSKTKDNISIFSPRFDGGKFDPTGLPIARVAKTEISAPIETVIQTWMDHANRVQWDTSLSDSQVVANHETGQSFSYFVRKPYLYGMPPRDFAFENVKSSGGLLGINDFNVVAIVNIDASANVPTTWFAVRCQANSVVLLRPLGPVKTEVTYFLELNPGGWFWPAPALASFLAGNSLVIALSNLKKSLEDEEEEELSKLSIEEAARRRFMKSQAQAKAKENAVLVNDAMANKEDLKNLLATLEKKLADLKASQSSQGLDLSALISRVEKDIKKTKERLRGMN